jgi:hypothetical protein
MSQQHLCFFSKRCPFSQQFLEALAKTPYSREFRFICVDPPGPGMPRPQLPAYVKAVPTLMIKGEPEPRVDSQVMNWLAERRLTDRSVMTSGGSVVPSEQSGGRGKPGQSNGGMQMIGGDIESSAGGPAAFMDSMCGAGDEGFCYISEMGVTPTSGSMARLAGNMVSFDDPSMMGGAPQQEHAPSMGSAGGGRGSNGQSAKAKALDDAMTQLLARRGADFVAPQRR